MARTTQAINSRIPSSGCSTNWALPYEDFGTTNGQSVDYPDFAQSGRAKAWPAGSFDRGILVCGTGVGMAIAANKVPGVRSAPIVDTDTARLSREHNDLNVLTLGARVLPESRAREIVKAFLQTPFEGGRHAHRVEKFTPSKARPAGRRTRYLRSSRLSSGSNGASQCWRSGSSRSWPARRLLE